MDDEYIKIMKAEADREKDLVSHGVCPQCGSRDVIIKKDSRQAGASRKQGVWHNARCACGYLVDWLI